MPNHLPPLITTTKTLASTPKWQEHEDQFRLSVALDIDGVTQMGLKLLGRCSRDYPDQNVTFQIEYLFKSFRTAPVARIDWRPLSPHTNRNIGPAEWRMVRIDGSHVHPFQENYDWMVGDNVPLADYMKLPIAIPLVAEPNSVTALVTVVGGWFNIEGVEAIPVPPWEPRLL
jgi:hypothetical protein